MHRIPPFNVAMNDRMTAAVPFCLAILSAFAIDAMTRPLSGLAILAMLLAVPTPVAAQPSEAEIDQGREVYGDFCVTCHGRDMVNPGGVTFDLRKFPKDDFERFRNAVLDGKPPAMPPWRDKLRDEDLKSLWAYVRSGG